MRLSDRSKYLKTERPENLGGSSPSNSLPERSRDSRVYESGKLPGKASGEGVVLQVERGEAGQVRELYGDLAVQIVAGEIKGPEIRKAGQFHGDISLNFVP